MKKIKYKKNMKELEYNEEDQTDEDEDFEKEELTNVDEEIFEEETKTKKKYEQEDYDDKK